MQRKKKKDIDTHIYTNIDTHTYIDRHRYRHTQTYIRHIHTYRHTHTYTHTPGLEAALMERLSFSPP